MIRHYYSAEVLYYTTRPLRPIYDGMPLLNLLVPDAVEDELARGRQMDSRRVLATCAGLDELPQVVPTYSIIQHN